MMMDVCASESNKETTSQKSEPQLKDEWWQLFDAKSKRFYYYNAKRELTQWNRPVSSSSTKPKTENISSIDKKTSSIMARSSSNASSGSSSLDNIDSDERGNDETACSPPPPIVDAQTKTTVCLLASKLMGLLVGQFEVDRNLNVEDLLEKTKHRLRHTEGNGSDSNSDRVGKEIQLLESLLALSENSSSRELFDESFNSYLTGSSSSLMSNSLSNNKKEEAQPSPSSFSSSSASSSSSSSASSSNGPSLPNSTPTTSRTPRQPRTNPNYINVNLIDKQNGSLLKNTYVRLDDAEESAKLKSKQRAAATSDSQMAAVLLMALLNSPSSAGLISDTAKSNEPTSNSLLSNSITEAIQTLQVTPITTSTNKMGKLSSGKSHTNQANSGKSLISCFVNTAEIETSTPGSKKPEFLHGSATTSLTRKTIEKKFSFLTSHSGTKSTNETNDTTTKNSKTSRQVTAAVIANAAAAAAVAAAVAKSTPKSLKLDESITSTTHLETSSLDLLSDDNTTLSPTPPPPTKQLLLNSAASVSSLADLPAVNSSSSPGQLNQKLKNLRRSFNTSAIGSKTSGTSLLSSSSSSQLDKGCYSPHNNHHVQMAAAIGGYMQIVDKENVTGDNQSNDSLVRKTSESNLLFIKTQIDLNVHHEKKLKSGLGGLLFFSTRKRIADHDLMVWTSQTIEKPLIKTNNKTIKKEACELFKLIQCYMGDRKSSSTTTNTSLNTPENSLRLKSSRSAAFISTQQPPQQHTTIMSSSLFEQQQQQLEWQINQNPQKDLTALEIMSKGWQHAQLRDELYLQIIKQTTSNINQASCLLGWQLMAVCLSFFPPTQKLYPFLGEYIMAHLDTDSCSNEYEQTDAAVVMLGKLARACMRRLERIQVTGAKKGLKAPTIEEIILSKSTILQASLFGTTLDEIMSMQRKKCPSLQLPWIQTVLSEAVLRLNGSRTEGIFRVPGDLDEVNNLKVKLDQLWCSEQVLSEHDVDIELMQSIQDPHLPASLLKLWYRELHEPLIPNEFYDECIASCDQVDKCLHIINEKLPPINRLVFTYLIRFLKVFAASDNVAVTKMDANNLSMVMAPNCLRCKSNEPKTIMENTKKEMQFIKTMIQHLDTDTPFIRSAGTSFNLPKNSVNF